MGSLCLRHGIKKTHVERPKKPDNWYFRIEKWTQSKIEGGFVTFLKSHNQDTVCENLAVITGMY